MDALLAGALLALVPLPSLGLARMGAAVSLIFYSLLAWRGNSFFFIAAPIQRLGYSALAIFFGSVLVMSLHSSTIANRICSRRGAGVLREVQLWHLYLALCSFEAVRSFERLGSTTSGHAIHGFCSELRGDSSLLDGDRGNELLGDRASLP